ncbi:MAG: AlpA family phage regulatory protein [Colwellia sp.]|nr:AlpA family phage regulatory protein [Colwellia sp.]
MGHLVKDGDFPEPIHLSLRTITWARSSIEGWIQSKINERE